MMRTTRRFAVRRQAWIEPEDGRVAEGLLVELSLDGCRIGNVRDSAKFVIGKPAQVEVNGFEPLDAQVRWSKDGVVGLCFVRSLTAGALDLLLETCRIKAAAA